jgi:hypothetical protein
LSGADLAPLQVVSCDKAENKPRRSDSSRERAANFRFPNAWMIAYWHLNDTQTADRSLDDQFHGPTVGGFFQFNRAERMCACSAEGTEVADSLSKEIPDQAGGQPIPKQRVPRKRAGFPCARESRTDSDIGASFGYGREEKRQLSRPVTVITIEKNMGASAAATPVRHA